MFRRSRWIEFGLPYMVGLTLTLALIGLAAFSSISSPFVAAQEQATATSTPEGGEPTPEPMATSETEPAARIASGADGEGQRVQNAEGEGEVGGATTTPTAPGTPSQVMVTRSDGALNASWPAVDGATSYHVTYSSDGGGSWSLAALNHPDASITIMGVQNGDTYIVGVRARNSAGDSGWRNSPAAGPFVPPTPTPTPESTPTPSTTTPSTTTPSTTTPSTTTRELTAKSDEVQAAANQAPRTIASTHDTHHRVTGGDNDCYKNHGVSYPSGETSYFEDPDGDTLTITSSSSHPGLAAITQNDPVRIRANHPADTWITITTTATDPGGLTADFTWKFKMTCTTSGSSLSVNENSAAGTKVGNAGKYNSGGSNYTIEGDAANAFTISNGVVKVKSGATLDYETKTSYSGTVKYDVVKDGTTYKSHRAVTITINNVGGPSMSAPTVTRDATTPTTELDISWTAANSTHPNGVTDYDVRYTQTGGSWANHAFTGAGTSTDRPGLTAGKKYEVQVRATDAEGTGAWSSSGEAITQYTTQTRSIAENSAAGTNIGAAVDADSNPNGYTLSYSLGGTDASKFSISASTGQITVGTGTDLDYETKTSYSVTVTMAASGGSSTGTGNTGLSPNGTGDYIIPVTINITDVDETPKFPSDTTTRDIAENSAVGTNIGAAVTASGGKAALTYSLDGTDKDKFTIVSSSGQIQVKTGHIPDYESKTSYSVQVKVTDGKDNSGNDDNSNDDTITVTINVTDVNEPPPKMAAPTVSKHSTTPKTKLDAAWTALSTSSMAGKPAVSDYDVRYRLHGTTGPKSWTDANFTGTGLSTTLSGLTSHKSYEVQVRAENAEGNGPWSDSGSAITDGDRGDALHRGELGGGDECRRGGYGHQQP